MVEISRLHARLRSAITPVATLALMSLMPLAALAQDADDKPVPMDPATKSLQLWVFGGIAGVVILAGVWYVVRIVQIRRSGRTTDAQAHWQD